MPSKASSKGFSAIEAVFIVLVIAVLGLGGWYVWHKNKKDDTAKSSTNSQTNNKPSDTPTPDPAKDDKYLVVKEWNLRVTLPQALQGDISYFVNDRAEKDFGGPVLVDFTSKKFSQGSLKCAVVESLPRSLVSIERIDGTNADNYSPKPFKTIGDKMYRLSTTSCAEAIEREGSAEDRQLLTSLKEAVTATLENFNQ